jgi:hypothetical protein
VLGAGVAYDLSNDPDYLVIYFGTSGSWLNDPVASLNERVQAKLVATTGYCANGRNGKEKGLLGGLEAQIASTNKTLLLILDQFEEYFQYHPNEEGPGTFAEEFPRLLRGERISVHFLLSIREDMLAILDRFKKRIPNLFGNRLRIDFLPRLQAIEAVLEPLDVFNKENHAPGPITMPLSVAQHVVDRIMTVQKGEKQRVQTPYLQLVLERWWNREVEAGSHEMREATLESIGGVETIVDRHLELTLNQMGADAKDLSAAIFRFMVAPGGRKIAQTATELAGNVASQYTESSVKTLLSQLREARILTTIPPPRDSAAGEQCYEFAHDVMARAAFDWRKRHVQQIETVAAQREAEEARRKEKAAHQQATKLRRLALSLGAILLLAIATTCVALRERQVGQQRELQAKQAQQEADSQRRRAEDNLALAQDREAQAKQAQQEADSQRRRAEDNLALAQDREAQAKRAQQEADSQRALAEARELIGAASSQLRADPELSILLALQADTVLRGQKELPPNLLRALLDALNRSVQTSRVQKTVELDRAEDVYDITFSQNRKVLATSGPSPRFRVIGVSIGSF